MFDELIYSYADLESLSNQTAHALFSNGIRPGDIVCQVVGSRPELIINLFGIIKCGATYAPLNPSLTERELAAQITDCQAALVIVEDDLVGQKLEKVGRELPKCHVLPVMDLSAQSGNMSRSPLNRLIDPDRTAVLCYTSGTTGRSKGVQLSHRNILTNARQVRDRTGVDPQDRLLVIMPIFHANGLCNQVLVPFLAGASIVLRRRFVLEEFWPTVVQYRPTYFTAVPTILSRFPQRPNVRRCGLSVLEPHRCRSSCSVDSKSVSDYQSS